MSSTVLKFIPDDPNFVPPPAARAEATRLLETFLPEGGECEAEVYDAVTFVDPGENLEAILCPACSSRSELDFSGEVSPVRDWWYEITDALEADDWKVEGRDVPMPCCSATVPLATLRFDWPAGFARFELSIWDPEIEGELPEAQVRALEQVLGCRLVRIRAHY